MKYCQDRNLGRYFLNVFTPQAPYLSNTVANCAYLNPWLEELDEIICNNNNNNNNNNNL
jgi:hypothetical protein